MALENVTSVVTSVVTLGVTLDATSVSWAVEPLAVIPLVEMALLAAQVVGNDLLLVVEFVVVFFYLLFGMDSMLLLWLELHMTAYESLPVVVVVPPPGDALAQ